MNRESAIFVAGGLTLVGAALDRMLRARGHQRVIDERTARASLTAASDVERLFSEHRPEYVFLVAGKSGGIAANQQRPADLMLDNLLVESLILSAAHRHGVRKLLYLASACCYPKHAEQPMRVESLMTGPLEPTNEAYALAKLAGIGLCRAMRREHGHCFLCAIPANIFGPGDDFSVDDSHVVAALIRRMHEAKLAGRPSIDVWGTGKARREFIFVDDVADACCFLMEQYDDEAPINVGSGEDRSIRQLAEIIRDVTGYQGRLLFDETRPDGMPRKALDSTVLLSKGWRPRTAFREGVSATYESLLSNQAKRSTDARTAV